MDFSDEPTHSDDLIVLDEKPYNAEPKVAELIQHNITPAHLVYSRNHCPVKTLDAGLFRLTIRDGTKETQLSMDQLKSYERVEIVAALQCAGNRRATMASQTGRKTEGLQWTDGTIANCRWTGVGLANVLHSTGFLRGKNEQSSSAEPRTGLHVCFASHVTACEQDKWFGASLPLEKVLDQTGDVMLAYEMNGQPLRPENGFPLRVVVPGYTGARWVKWLDTITITNRESDNFYQTHDYKILPPQVQTHDAADEDKWWDKLPPLMSNVLNSAIATVDLSASSASTGETEQEGRAVGYAVGGAQGGQVERVEISLDAGQNWSEARIRYKEGRWSWVIWEADFRIQTPRRSDGTVEVRSRATDVSGVAQLPECDWNLRGVAYNGYGKFAVPG